MSPWFDYLGKFHPVVLHLPIGAMVFTFVLVLLALRDQNPATGTIKIGLIFSFFGALISSLLGYLLYQSGGYDEASVQNHLILGWVSTFGIGLLWYLLERVVFQKVFAPIFFIVLVAIGLTGHFGGTITHGEGYLDFPEPAPVEVAVNLDSIQLYSQAVAKIFDSKCVSCHNYSKRKGGLAMHLPQALLEGGERGMPYEVGNVAESRLIRYANLPLEDDLHMPPQGRPQLTPTEIELLSHWIASGASFDHTVAYAQLPETVQEAMDIFLPKPLPDVPPLSSDDVLALQENGFRVSSFLANTPFIQVKFEKKELDPKAIGALVDVADQLVELELANTTIAPLLWDKLPQFKQLQKLRLDNTNTSDEQLQKLMELPLRSLNLAGTSITASGISLLSEHPQLEQLYAWNTQVIRQEESTLQEKTPIKLVFGVFEGFSEPQRLKPPMLDTEKTLFETEQLVSFYDKVKGNTIRYTLDGSDPDSTSTLYQDAIVINKSLTLKARVFKSGWLPSPVFEEQFFKVNKTIADYTMETRPSNRYSGVHKLFDFEEGSTNFADGKWLGFSGNDLVFTTQVAAHETINNITVSCMESIGGWIIYPKRVRVLGRKGSGTFTELGRYEYRPREIPTETTKKSFTVPVKLQQHTELKVIVENIKKLPQWHPAAGEDSWLFVDEILFW